MVTKRTPINRHTRRHINQRAIEAWKTCDYQGLHLGRVPAQQKRGEAPYWEDEIGTSPGSIRGTRDGREETATPST
jgi:hypothetical protein